MRRPRTYGTYCCRVLFHSGLRRYGIEPAGVDNTSFLGSSDFVIGYRLAKIMFHKNAAGVRVSKQYKHTDGAILGVKQGQNSGDSSSAITKILTFDGDDAVAQDLREKDLITAIDEDDNKECGCFAVPSVETKIV